MELLALLCSLAILAIPIEANPTNETNKANSRVNASLPSFTWIDHFKIEVEFPDGKQDKIVLWKPEKIANINVSCLFDGTIEGEASSDVVVSGCKDDHLVSITIHSNRLIGRTMFLVRNSFTEEILNPYANGELLNEDYDYDEEDLQRSKRSIYEDYVEEDYPDMEYDDPHDPPPRLNLDMKLGFEESLKAQLGGETAARDYVVEVFTHARSYMKHSSLGTSLILNLVGTPTFVPNKYWTARRDSVTDAKTVKVNEAIPIIYFCYDGDDDTKMGLSMIRKACDPTEGVGILKYRKNVPLAANTMNHEKGHLVGLQHDRKEDQRDGGSKDNPCHGEGFMSEMAPSNRPTQFTTCSARRFKLWYNNYGTCLTEIKIPENWKTCPYPHRSAISPCLCKVDNKFNVYLFCETMNKQLLQSLATSFQCSKKIHRMEINMNGEEMDCSFGLDNIGSLEMEHFYLYNVSKITADIEANAFAGSSKTLKEIKIQRLSGMESSEKTIKTEAFSNLIALEKVDLGEDFQKLQTKSFSGLSSVVNLNIKGVKTIETKAFYDLAALKKLDLTQSPLETINTEAFFNLPLLTTINFNPGTITTLQTRSFSGLPSLTMLDLSGNKIQALPSNSFYNLADLTLANLTKNQIKDLSSYIFTNLPKLGTIDLSHNAISSLPSKVFENLPLLTKIYLNNNKIKSIHDTAVMNTPKLKLFDMGKNEVQEIGKFLENLKYRDLVVDLSDTKITFLKEESLKSFVEYIVTQEGRGYIDLSSAKLECGCEVQWLLKHQDRSIFSKFQNAVCEDGHALEEVDDKLLEHLCPSDNCRNPLLSKPKKILTGCSSGATLLSSAPGQTMVLCKDVTNKICERDFETLCPVGSHLCTWKEFNNRNDGWNYNWKNVNTERPLGVVYCRKKTGGTAGNFAPHEHLLSKDEKTINCWYGSSRPGCEQYLNVHDCDQQKSSALCCSPNSKCGNGVVDEDEEDCDDGNDIETDECLNSCTWKRPIAHGLKGQNC